MALQKTFTKDNGTSGNYWRIIDYRDARAGKVAITIACYKDKAFRDAIPDVNPTPLMPRKDVFVAAKNFVIDKPVADDYIAGAYTELKKDSFFSGAIDC